MALLLDGTNALKNASSNYAGRPLTIGVWVNIANGTSGTEYIFAFLNAALTEAIVLADDDGSGIIIGETVSGVGAGFLTLTRTKGVGLFIIFREISTTSRSMSMLDSSTGIITHASDTTSVASPSVTQQFIGCSDDGAGALGFGLEGSIAELWYANVDAQIGGGQIDEPLMRQLAYGGPFSVPHVAQAVREYRSFRKCTNSRMDEVGEVYAGNGLGPQTWAEFGSSDCARGPHPSLPYWYVTPEQYTRNLMV